MTCTSDFSPIFQPQNPAITGDRNGWENCAAYVGAMAHDYATCGLNHVTGKAVRAYTNEPVPDPASPGLNVLQVRDALARLGVSVTPFLRASWAQVVAWVAEGRYVSLCVGYSVIRPTRFSGDPNFYGGHQIGVPPGWEVEDPLCDGRRAGIYKYHHEPYPVDLVRRAAGAFSVLTAGHVSPIGLGWAQGFYTAPHPAPVPAAGGHTLHIAAGTTEILVANLAGGCIASWTRRSWGGGASSAPCLAPVKLPGCSSGSATVARATAGAFNGQLVRVGGGISVS